MRFFLFAFVFSFVLIGCNPQPENGDKKSEESKTNNSSSDTEDKDTDDKEKDDKASKSEAKDTETGNGNTIKLTSENTNIGFVGYHVVETKPDPNAREGGFNDFNGSIAMDDSGNITSIEVEIETDSIFTKDNKLTQHLKSADFFDVGEFPKAMFKSTKVEMKDNKATITGDFTLLKVSKEIQFPAVVEMKDGSLSFSAEFELDRTLFGMNYGEGKVEPLVKMTVSVGK